MKRDAIIACGAFRFWWRFPLLLALAGCSAGCLVIPMPHTNSGYARTNVNQHVQERFVPGLSTREDVIMALGEPDAVSTDERQLAYRSENVVAFWIVAAATQDAGAGGASGGTIYQNHFYSFEFDPRGRLHSVKQSGQLGIVRGMHEPQLNPATLTLAGSNDVAVGVSRGAYWLPNVDGFRSKGAKSNLGEPGELRLTESNLVFTTASQFANAGPALNLPLNSVVRVYVDNCLSLRRLVIHTETGLVHSFQIIKPGGLGGFTQDKLAMKWACDFIQSKIQTTQPKP